MPAATSPTPVAGGYRADIQALRAVAVALVVGYHLTPGVVSGGYVGVDVFFVISGFLITSHLVREHERSGRIALRAFYVRRIRRLLPAALLVLLVLVVAYAVVMPESTRQQGYREIIASALYVENWVLAFSAVDYLGAAAAPSLVQHYWSLSVEEQFYIVWPLLIVVVGWISLRTSPGAGSRNRMIALWAVFGVSLLASIVVTAVDPEWAYFVTPVRAWEFAAGGLVALHAWRPVEGREAARTVASWAGLMAIAASALLYTPDTPFPGSAALVPVLGTVLVIVARDPRTRWSPMLLGRTAPVQFLGGVSYSVYLWHWPLIILYPVVVGHEPGWRGTAVVLVATLLVATASKRLVEDPFLRRRQRAPRFWPTAAATAGAMAVLVVVSTVQIGVIDARTAATAQQQQGIAEGPCYGARALADDGCSSPREIPADIDTGFAATDYADTTLGDCGKGDTVGAVGDAVECSFGDEASDRLVVMVGDSHAGHWLPAVQSIAADEDWHVVTFFRSSCPFTEATPSASGVFQAACEDWKARVHDRVAELAPDLALVASLSPYGYTDADFDPGPVDAMQDGYVASLATLASSASEVVVLRDTPFMQDNIPDCLGGANGTDCDRARATVLDAHADPLWAASALVPGVARVDLTDAFCDDITCFAVTGGVVIYRDHHHMGASYSRSLAPELWSRLDAAGVVALP
jgi:peptidoglycan/LPS O-acetylase OafA/YrhL